MYNFSDGKLLEAVAFFEAILTFEPKFLKSSQNLDNVKHQLIERWHFGMLNDAERNAKYKSAIKRAIQARGQVSALDIGTGTGLLALYAAECGAESVYACEQSMVMCELSKKSFQLNGCDDRIKLIPKHSTHIDVENDLNGKVDLVITETMDCGVFGEGLLQTLIHAKENLLKNSGQIIPGRVRMFIAGYQCRTLAAEKNVVNSSSFTDTIYVRNYSLCSSDDEPYDSCYVQQLSDFRLVTKVEEALDVNLNNLDELYALFNGTMKKNVQLAYVADDEISILDGFCTWFSLSLDTDSSFTIDTNPFEQSSGDQQSCWECAIFRLNHRFDNTQKLQNLNVTISCKNGALHLEHFYNFFGKSFSNISSDIIRFLNDTEYIDRIEYDVFAELKRRSKKSLMPKLGCVMDFLPFPSVGIALIKEGRLKKLYCSREAQELVTFIANANCIALDSIVFVDDPADVLFVEDKFEIIILPLVEKYGTISSAQLCNYSILKNSKLKPAGFMVPERVEVLAQLVNSKWLRSVTKVTDPEVVDRLQIGALINKYATTIQMELSEEFPHKCVYDEYRVAEVPLTDGLYEISHQLYVGELTETNLIHGIFFYFNLMFTRSSKGALSTKRSNSFTRTACFVSTEQNSKRDNGFVTLNYQQNCGVMQMSIK